VRFLQKKHFKIFSPFIFIVFERYNRLGLRRGLWKMKTVSAHFDVISKANTAKLLIEQAVPQRQKTSSSLVLKNQLQSSGRQSAELRGAIDRRPTQLRNAALTKL